MRSKYWFVEDSATVAKTLVKVHSNWQKYSTNPVIQAWIRNTISYYSSVLEPAAWETALTFEGEQGELVRMLVPEARAAIRQLVSLLCKQRLAFQCTAEAQGSDVVQETRLGNALASQIVDVQRLDRKREKLAELACVVGSAFTAATWRTDRGRPHAVDEGGNMLYDGDLEIRVLSPLDVFYDYQIEEWDDRDWVEIRSAKSRWSLIAQHPELENEILHLPRTRDWQGPKSPTYESVSDEDMVYCYEVYHKPTPAIPQGRMLMYSDERTIYYDGPNRYGEIPVEPCIPEPVMGMGFGYPLWSSLMPAQEMYDHSMSAIATNQAAFAVQNVTAPRGAGISVQAINGMNWISFTPQNVPGGGKPEALQLTQSSPETFKFAEILRDRITSLSYLNSAIRGQPPAGVTSGAAIATLTTNALEFMTSFSSAINECMERTVQKGINAYRKFATTPHLISMAGKNFQSYSKPFKGSDLDPVKKVKMIIANPLMMTIAGRADIAEKAIKSGLVKSMQEYISVLSGDDLDKLWETERSENDLICSENDDLMEGTPVQALSTDDHPAHIRKHAGLLNDPAVRRNSQRVQAILDHVLEHEQLAKDTDPFLTAMVRTGKQPEMGPPPGPGGGAAPMPPGGGEMGPEAGEPTSEPAEPAPDMLGR